MYMNLHVKFIYQISIYNCWDLWVPTNISIDAEQEDM